MSPFEALILRALLVAPQTRPLTMSEHLAIYAVARYMYLNEASGDRG